MGMEVPHHLADDLRALAVPRVEDSPIVFMPYSTRRCAGLSPSRTSGSARPMMTLIA